MSLLGGIVEKAFDSVGLPEWSGDVAAGLADLAVGDYVSVADDSVDLCGEEDGLGGLLQDALAGAGEAFGFDAQGLGDLLGNRQVQALLGGAIGPIDGATTASPSELQAALGTADLILA
jgi:hypothetical protein